MEIKHPIIWWIVIFVVFSVVGFLIGFFKKPKKK